MKISHKMILLFSAMILLIVLVNTAYLGRTKVEGSDALTADRYQNMAVNMIRNMEEYVTMMDLAIEDLTSDTAFMEAFYQVALGADEDPATVLSNQNKMFQALYHSPIADNFYRVSIFSESGFYLSNHIDRNDSIVSMSDESKEMIAGIPYLRAVRSAPYRRHIISSHRDRFNLSRDVDVFSAIHSVTWHGEHVGYIEVAADCGELDNLLLTDNQNAMIRAVFKDGSILFASPEDEAIYDDIPLNKFTAYVDPCGLERNVYHIESRWLNLDIYLAEDASIRYTAVAAMIWEFARNSLVISAVALLLVVVISLNLTHSTRCLTRKVRSLPADQLLLSVGTEQLSTFVTSPKDFEIHELERSFNDMLLQLHDSTCNEIAMRESTLRAHFKALQAQINPHFVYNTLNSISAKGMESGNEDIVNMCDQFAQMLRYSTDTRSETATLGEDLAHVRNYLMLLKARYEERLTYSIHVPDEMNALVIPKLTLQPLVENAMTHGFGGNAGVRRVEIVGTIQAGQLCLEIRDNGCGFSPEVLEKLQRAISRINANSPDAPDNEGHIGLLNTCLRLHYYSKGAMRMQIMNDHGAVVRVTTPLQK